MNIVIFGSCVTRDAFEYAAHSCVLVDYFARSSLGSAYAGPAFPALEHAAMIESAFQKRIVQYDLEKTFPGFLNTAEFDLLIYDPIDERFDLLETPAGEICTLSGELGQTGIKKHFPDAIASGTERFFDYWQKGWCALIAQLDRLGMRHALRINKVYWSKEAQDGQGYDPVFTPAQIAAANAFLDRLYSRMAQDLHASQFFQFDEALLRGAAKHKWGRSPFHYVTDYYHSLLQQVTAQAAQVKPWQMLDQGWKQYLSGKKIEQLNEMIKAVAALPYPAEAVRRSEYFSQSSQRLLEAYRHFMLGDESVFAAFLPQWQAMSNPQKTALSNFLCHLLPIRVVTHDTLSAQDRTQLAQAGIDMQRFDALCDVLEYAAEEKLRMLQQGALPDIFQPEGSFAYAGTSLIGGAYMRLVSPKGKAYLISVSSPADGLFLPALGLVIRSQNFAYDLVERTQKVVKLAVRNDAATQCWAPKATLPMVNVIRDKRPYHVLADEISGNFYLRHMGMDFPLLSMEPHTFFERELFDFPPMNMKAAEEFARDKIVFANHQRLNQLPWGQSYREWLLQCANALYPERIRTGSGPCLWISITGGEKRAWVEETEALTAAAAWFARHYPSGCIMFDGWTGVEKLSDSDKHNIARHEAIMYKIIRDAGLDPARCGSVIGSQILRKLAAASQCDFYICCVGTPSMWPSNICKLPGMVHSSTEMIHEANYTMNVANAVKIPDHMIRDIREDLKKDRWDYVSYSISVDNFMQVFTTAITRTLKLKEAS